MDMPAGVAADTSPLLPVRIFLSSPGDLFPVREAVKTVIDKLNLDPLYENRYKFILYAYEDRVPPVLAEEPQLAVDKYNLKPEQADIFLCLFWKRLGTPTAGLIDADTAEEYPSGTVYELLSAYRARRARPTPVILLYRCTAPANDPRVQTPEQEQALALFLQRFRDGGDLTGLPNATFETAQDLSAQLLEHLKRVVEVELRSVLQARLIAHLERLRTNQMPNGARTPALTVVALSEADPQRLGFALKLGPHPPDAYFERPVFHAVRDHLRALADASRRQQPASLGAALFGPMLAGKTRLALEALRAAAPDYMLVVWPHGRTDVWGVDQFAGHRVALLLDDLHEFAASPEADTVRDVVARLRDLCPHLLIVATARSGEADRGGVYASFWGLLEWLRTWDLARMTEEEKVNFQRFAAELTTREPAQVTYPASFDGYPGSLFLNLSRRQRQLQAPEFPAECKAVLKALRLLRVGGIYRYPERRVRRASTAVFDLPSPDTESAWQRARDRLNADDWLAVGPADRTGQSELVVPVDAYLDDCVREIYPIGQRRVADDFPRLLGALSDAPVDVEGLIQLADAWRRDPGARPNLAMAGALECCERALASLERRSDDDARLLLADVRTVLGRIYLSRNVGEPRDNLESAIEHLEWALSLRPDHLFPVHHAALRVDLGNAYTQLADLFPARDEWIERAARAYETALQLFKDALGARQDGAPLAQPVGLPPELASLEQAVAWTQTRLARVRGAQRGDGGPVGSLDTNVEERIQAALDGLEESGTEPGVRVRTLVALARAFLQRRNGSRSENVERALEFFTMAQSTLSGFITPDADLQAQLLIGAAVAYRQRLVGQRRTNLLNARNLLNGALQLAHVSNDSHATSDLSATQDDLGMVLLELAEVTGFDLLVDDAIRTFEDALLTRTAERQPLAYAETCRHLASALLRRSPATAQDNYERAIATFEKALAIYSVAEHWDAYRDTLLDLAWIYYSVLVRRATLDNDELALEAALRRAHELFMRAKQVQQELGWLNEGLPGNTDAFAPSERTRQMYAADAWCLWHLHDLRGAIVALESGRAQALGSAVAVQMVSTAALCPEHAAQFLATRDAWSHARRQAHAEQDEGDTLQAVRARLLGVRMAIRAHCAPDFLPGELAYESIAPATRHGHTLVYIAATEHGGLALCVPPVSVTEKSGLPEPYGTVLPVLSEDLVERWIYARDEDGRVVRDRQRMAVGDFSTAVGDWIGALHQGGQGSGQSGFAVMPLENLLAEVSARGVPSHTDARMALEQVVTELRNYPLVAATSPEEARGMLALPAREAVRHPTVLARAQAYAQMDAIDEALVGLAEYVAAPLCALLDSHEGPAADRRVALIACGALGALPLHAAKAREPDVPLMETCQLSQVLSTRLLLAAQASVDNMASGGAFLAVGSPSTLGLPQLRWAELEAREAARLVVDPHLAGVRGAVLTREAATRAAVMTAIQQLSGTRGGLWVLYAGVAHAEAGDPASTFLGLAHQERLTAHDLVRQRLLEGVRLFIAHASETARIDIERGPDEVNSLAAALLQSGAVCVLACPWQVDDFAGYILALRFLQELRSAPEFSASRALARAARWLRSATRNDLAGWIHSNTNEQQRDSAPLGVVNLGDKLPYPFAHPVYWAGLAVFGLGEGGLTWPGAEFETR